MMDRTEVDVLSVMLQQEQKTYQIIPQNVESRSRLGTRSIHSINYICCDLSQHEERASCRYNMVDWCYRMINFCNLNRETVAIAMNYVDRFVVTEQGQSYLTSDTLYQLVAVTALYTAIKVHEIQSIDLQSLVNVSKGTYSLKQIERVEREIVNALQWRMNPPTAMSFVRSLIELIPHHYKLSAKVRESILKLSRVQAEYAVFDQELANSKMSTVGYCSLINAMRTMIRDQVMLKNIKHTLAQELKIQLNNSELEQAQPKLYLLLSNKNNIGSGANQLNLISPQ